MQPARAIPEVWYFVGYSRDDTEWIGKQHLFFVATAPTDLSGHLNRSPKGGQKTLRVLGPTTVAYLNLPQPHEADDIERHSSAGRAL
ncbi:MAG: hypothetical protein ACRDJW_19885 [Thermomicrobiales bacterium]